MGNYEGGGESLLVGRGVGADWSGGRERDQICVDVVYCRCVKGVVWEGGVMGEGGLGGGRIGEGGVERVQGGGLCCQPSGQSPLPGRHRRRLLQVCDGAVWGRGGVKRKIVSVLGVWGLGVTTWGAMLSAVCSKSTAWRLQAVD